jgi:hypothetical protein
MRPITAVGGTCYSWVYVGTEVRNFCPVYTTSSDRALIHVRY